MKKISSVLFIVILLISLFSSFNTANAYVSLDSKYYDIYREFMEDNEATNYSRTYGKATIYMHDTADKCTDAQESSMIAKVGNELNKENVNVLFLTYDDNFGFSTMTFSDDYMDLMFPDSENNIAFVLDMDTREVYINTMGVFIQEISDMEIERSLDAGWNHIISGNYGEGVEDIALYAIHHSIGRTAEKSAKILAVGIATAISAGITLIVVIYFVGQHNAANKKISAKTYLNQNKGSYEVVDKDATFIKSRTHVSHNYYKPSSSSSGGGGSSHRSSGGRSHGGGGRRF